MCCLGWKGQQLKLFQSRLGEKGQAHEAESFLPSQNDNVCSQRHLWLLLVLPLGHYITRHNQLITTQFHSKWRAKYETLMLRLCIALSLQLPDRFHSAWENLDQTGQLCYRKTLIDKKIDIKSTITSKMPRGLVVFIQRLFALSTPVILCLSLNQDLDWATKALRLILQVDWLISWGLMLFRCGSLGAGTPRLL